MKLIARAPLFFVALHLFAGICLSPYLKMGGYFLLIPLLFLLLWIFSYRFTHFYQGDLIKHSVLAIFFVWIGIALPQLDFKPRQAPSLETINCQEVEIMGVVTGRVRKSPYGKQAWIEAFAYQSEKEWHRIQGKLDLRCKLQDTLTFQQYDSIQVRGYLTTMYTSSQGYGTYLQREGILHSLYLEQGCVHGTNQDWKYAAWWMQNYLSEWLKALFVDVEAGNIARAMLLGDRSALDRDTKKAFSDVGISHILAISGLHVGIIFLCLDFLLMWLHRFPRGKRIKQGVILMLLLAYMFVSGASPAVVRATLMFGTILVMRLLRERYVILNVVSLAALIQMMVEPSVVFSLGFQLSYSAVVALVTLYPALDAYFQSDYILLNILNGWIGVTLVATLATAPLIWVHFGKFPTYFLLSNVLVSAFAFGAVLTGFLTILFIWIPGLNALLAQACTLCIRCIHLIAQLISSSPHAVIQDPILPWEALGILMIQLLVAAAFLFFSKYGAFFSFSRR
ncbi:MAG: ComEC/Rec2 family competence protein [Bacteroidota bacterium]